jgi:hypothetical protein
MLNQLLGVRDKVAMARRLAVRLYWMRRQQRDYGQVKSFSSHAGLLGNRHGVQVLQTATAWTTREGSMSSDGLVAHPLT